MPNLRFFMVFLGLCLTAGAHAAQDQVYGLGGSTTGRVGSLAAEPENAYSALLNPALLAASEKREFAFSLGGVAAHFDAPQGVILDSRKYRTRDGEARGGTASIPDVRTTLMSTGYTHPIPMEFLQGRRLALGLALSGPLGQFRRWVALSPYDFTLLRYGAADTQFKGTFGGGLELIPKTLFIGGGVSLFMTSNGVTEAALNSENQTGRMAMDIAFNTAGIVGIYSRLGSLGASVVYRQPVNPVLRQTFEGTVQMGGPDVANQPAAIESSLYYEPGVLECELQGNWRSFVASIGMSLQQWSQYQPRYLTVSTRDASGAQRSTAPALIPMRDTWNPRASIEWRGSEKWRVSAGYQFRPSPILDLSTAGNLLDADTHVTGLNIQRYMGNFLFLDGISLGVYGQTHFLSPRTVVKSSADFIGAPGYTVSGRALVFGATLTSSL